MCFTEHTLLSEYVIFSSGVLLSPPVLRRLHAYVFFSSTVCEINVWFTGTRVSFITGMITELTFYPS